MGIPHLALAVGQGPNGATILSLQDAMCSSVPGTQFGLIPLSAAEAQYKADAKSAILVRQTGNPFRKAPSSTFEHCGRERALCGSRLSVALSAGQSIKGARARRSFALERLRIPACASQDQEMSGFDYDASIAYLGPTSFSSPYNLHALIHSQRDTEASSSADFASSVPCSSTWRKRRS